MTRATTASASEPLAGDRQKPVWADVKKTREQLRPNRIIHRAYEFLNEKLLDGNQPVNLQKDMKGKRLLSNGEIIAYTSECKLRFSPHGQTKVSADLQAQACEFAEN